MKFIESQIESVLEAASSQISDLAAEYRARVLVPLCRRRRLTYITGNGRTVFYTRRGDSVGSAQGAELDGHQYLVAVFHVLDMPVFGRDDVFGYYVRDVREEDW